MTWIRTFRGRDRSSSQKKIRCHCPSVRRPSTIGIVADALGGSGGGRGLQLAFLVSLPLLLANGIILLLARKPLEREGRDH
jgi:hypothetical protein